MTLRLGPEEGIAVLRVVIGSVKLRMESHMIRDPRVPRAFVMLLNPDQVNQSVDHTYLKSRYSLSRAEIRIAEAIVVGMSVSKMAEMFDVSAETIRTQLKAVYQKTGCEQPGCLEPFDCRSCGGAIAVRREPRGDRL